jgi:hypothetical protein
MSQRHVWSQLESHTVSWINREIECRVDVHGRGIDTQVAIVFK